MLAEIRQNLADGRQSEREKGPGSHEERCPSEFKLQSNLNIINKSGPTLWFLELPSQVQQDNACYNIQLLPTSINSL